MILSNPIRLLNLRRMVGIMCKGNFRGWQCTSILVTIETTKITFHFKNWNNVINRGHSVDLFLKYLFWTRFRFPGRFDLFLAIWQDKYFSNASNSSLENNKCDETDLVPPLNTLCNKWNSLLGGKPLNYWKYLFWKYLKLTLLAGK